MAGRRRKNTVAGSKKESPKTQNTLQETNVSTDKEQKLMLKSRQKMLMKRKLLMQKLLKIRKCRQKQKQQMLQ